MKNPFKQHSNSSFLESFEYDPDTAYGWMSSQEFELLMSAAQKHSEAEEDELHRPQQTRVDDPEGQLPSVEVGEIPLDNETLIARREAAVEHLVRCAEKASGTRVIF